MAEAAPSSTLIAAAAPQRRGEGRHALFVREPEISVRYSAFLTDESRLKGFAECIALPQSEEDVAEAISTAAAAGMPVTISGARTGITGGAAPLGGCVLSCAAMKKFLGLRRHENRFLLRCQPGVTLAELNAAVAAKSFPASEEWVRPSAEALAEFRESGPYFLPPDPTETSASLGGMVACNASGARSFHYGPVRRYISALRLALPDNAILALARGETAAAHGGSFTLLLPNGEKRAGRIPSYTMPATKNAAGYYAAPGMDLIDLFIGAEGTLGVVTEIELELVPLPKTILDIVAFFPDEACALAFVHSAKSELRACGDFAAIALEFFDGNSLALLRTAKAEQGAGSAIAVAPAEAGAAVCLELAGETEDAAPALEQTAALIEKTGGAPDTAWMADSAAETKKIKEFRHALPETINRLIARRAEKNPGLTKLGTDFAVPEEKFDSFFGECRKALKQAGLQYAAFGHIGDNHLHINILPRDSADYEKGKALYAEFAAQAVRYGGTVSAEHGIGKLKKHLLQLMFGENGIAEMRAVKKVFDPRGILNPGNMFSC